MMSVLKGLFGVEPYRWDSLVMKHNIPKNYERRVGRGKSIYRRWGLNDSAYYVNIPKSIRKGMTWEQTKAMRMDIWKQRQKRRVA